MNHLEKISELRKKGLRLTPQREMILSVIHKMKGHVSAEVILDRVRKKYPYLNKSVVYRTLKLFTELRLLDQTDFGKGHIEYELHEHPHHHHLLCRKCGRTIRMDGKIFASFERNLQEKYGFTPAFEHSAITGWCRHCQMCQMGTRPI